MGILRLTHILANILSTFLLAGKRLWNQRQLVGPFVVGLTLAVAMLASIPLYSDAAHHRVLESELVGGESRFPPFAFLWRHVGRWHGNISWDDYRLADGYLGSAGDVGLDLPLQLKVAHVKTDPQRLFPAGESSYLTDEPLAWASVGFMSQLESHAVLVEGNWPQDSATEDGAIDVLVSLTTADELGLQVGERFILFAGGGQNGQLFVRIAGIWTPSDLDDPYWFYQPSVFDDTLLTSPALFEERIARESEGPVALASWYQVYDGSAVRAHDVPFLLARIVATGTRLGTFLPDATLDVSPIGALQSYARAAGSLTNSLTFFSLPVLGLVLFFIWQISAMLVRQGSAEIALLRSRGGTRGQVVFSYLIEGLLLAAIGMTAGIFVARWLAILIGRSLSFLSISPLAPAAGASLEVVYTPTAFLYGGAGAVLALLALLLPSLSAAAHNVVSFRRASARENRRPFWQRYCLDLLLLVLSFYGRYLFARQAEGLLTASDRSPMADPLLFLVPSLFCLALALLAARMLPWLMELAAQLVAFFPGVVGLMVARQLARATGRFLAPLLLLALTMALATFCSTMAATLDLQLEDSAYYQVGADLRLAELGEEQGTTRAMPALSGEDEEQVLATPLWSFLPVEEHLSLPGVVAAARVGAYPVTVQVGGNEFAGQLRAVDRADFSAVAFYRPDMGDPLNALLNRLAPDWANILVSREFLQTYQLAPGDTLWLSLRAGGEMHRVAFVVAGALDRFPTHDPQAGPLFVANLEYLFEALGGSYPYQVWLRTAPDISTTTVVDGVRELGVSVIDVADARAQILEQRQSPQRQGVLGLLSVGFVGAAVLTVLGFLVYALHAFQERFIELGTLRALGLSIGQVALYLLLEMAVLVIAGALLGIGSGLWAGYLFMPHLRLGTAGMAATLPFVVQIGWDRIVLMCMVFGIMFLLAAVGLTVKLARMRMFEAVKLGETI